MEGTNEMYLSDMERDVIGEVMNISLGSSATSLSSLLNQRVDITVPQVNVVSAQKFTFEDLEPAVGVEIKYISGIEGDNVMILKKADIKVILETLTGSPIADEDFELDELAMSAVCEVMNQMMGSAATALADFLGKRVDISTPIAYEIQDKNDFKGRYFKDNDSIVAVKFKLKVGDVINSEFINVISVDLAKEMVSLFLSGTGLGDDVDMSQTESKVPEPVIETPAQEPIRQEVIPDEVRIPEVKEPIKEKEERQEEISHPKESPKKTSRRHRDEYEDEYEDEDEDDFDDDYERPRKRPKRRRRPEYYEDEYEDDEDDYDYEPRRRRERKPKKQSEPVSISPITYESFDSQEEDPLSEEQMTNLGLIMSVPLQISVEIGKTKKKIKEILEFKQGTIVELNKQAGAQVDIIVNGQVIAKGDVVVVNDNFGVRITEIVKKDEIVKATM